MTPENTMVPHRARVSIAERLVPSLAFALAAISGIAGSMLIINLFDRLRSNETAGIATVLQGLGQVEITIASILVFAAVIGLAGLGVIVARIFMTTRTASVPGVFLLIAGLPSLIPPLIVAYTTWMVADAITSPTLNFAVAGSTAATLCVAATVVGGISLVILLVFSLVPLKSRLGRKLSPLICFLLVEGGIVILVAIFFWLASAAWTAFNTRG